MRAWMVTVLAVLAALVLHAAILLFGGIFFLDSGKKAEQRIEEVDLLTAEPAAEEQSQEAEPAAQEAAPLAVQDEPPPQLAELEDAPPPLEPTDVVARLDALSLGALESALAPATGGDGFGDAGSLASGGRIGGTGLPGASGALDAGTEDAVFDIGALDQRPRVVHQTAPVYPSELLRRKLEGTVSVVFVVDTDGRVQQPVVEAASHEAFRGPALDAVRRWRFEPAVVHGEKVRAKLRVPIRFSVSS